MKKVRVLLVLVNKIACHFQVHGGLASLLSQVCKGVLLFLNEAELLEQNRGRPEMLTLWLPLGCSQPCLHVGGSEGVQTAIRNLFFKLSDRAVWRNVICLICVPKYHVELWLG